MLNFKKCLKFSFDFIVQETMGNKNDLIEIFELKDGFYVLIGKNRYFWYQEM